MTHIRFSISNLVANSKAYGPRGFLALLGDAFHDMRSSSVSLHMPLQELSEIDLNHKVATIRNPRVEDTKT